MEQPPCNCEAAIEINATDSGGWSRELERNRDMEDLTELLCQLWAASQAYGDVKKYLPVHLVKPQSLASVSCSCTQPVLVKRDRASLLKGPQDWLGTWVWTFPMSLGTGSCRGTETGPVRQRKNLLAMLLVRAQWKN